MTLKQEITRGNVILRFEDMYGADHYLGELDHVDNNHIADLLLTVISAVMAYRHGDPQTASELLPGDTIDEDWAPKAERLMGHLPSVLVEPGDITYRKEYSC